MIEYYSKYKDERYHDDNLISLAKFLDQKNSSSLLFQNILGIKHNDILKEAHRKRDFDVILKYQHVEIIIETKVDSNENEYEEWQTQRIHQKYSDKKLTQYFIYLTYGSSEFYGKQNENNIGTGPWSSAFKHAKLDNIIQLLEQAHPIILGEKRFEEWKVWLKFEKFKRENYQDYLNSILDFIRLYKGPLRLTDTANNRLNISIPEFLVIHFHKFAEEWNKLNFSDLKHIELYPVGRQGRVNDIILNFKKLCIRAHEDEDVKGFMFFTLYLPEKREDQGFVWEEPFHKVITGDGDESMVEKNSISSNYLKTAQLKENMNLTFTFTKNKSRKGILSLTLTIKGTPFIGDKLLEERFYKLI